MKTLALALCLLLAGPSLAQDGGCPTCAFASPIRPIPGGNLITDPTLECLACETIARKTELDALDAQPPPPQSGSTLKTVLVVTGFLLAGALGYEIGKHH